MVRTELDFSELIVERTADFTGREWIFRKVDDWLTAGASRVLLLTGGPGSGKSAVAARLVQLSAAGAAIESSHYIKPGVLSYAHFCQAKEDKTVDAVRFVEALSGHLASRYETFLKELLEATDPNVTLNVDATQHVGTVAGGSVTNVAVTIQGSGISARAAFDRSVRRPLEQIYGKGFSDEIVVLVDGLDEALSYDTGSDIVTLLKHMLDAANGLPPKMRFILTCRSNEKRVLNVITGERIDLIDNALPTPPGSLDDVGKYVHHRLNTQVKPQLSKLADRIATKSKGNFLYARFVLDDLLASGRPLHDPDTLALPDKLEDAYHQFLEREVGANTAKWQKSYRPILAALVVAHGAGLTRQQILGITALPKSTTDDVLWTCGQFFVPSPPQGPFRFYHESFREYLQSDEDPTFQVYPAEANEAIGHCFVGEYGGNWGECADEYALQYTPIHLLEAARRADTKAGQRALAGELHRLLLESGFGGAVIGRFRSPRALFDDLRLGLELALEREDVVQIWRYVNRYRTVLQDERRPNRVVAEVQVGNFEAALDRTGVYGAMPNSQGMLRLWIGWHAAVSKQTEMATRAATLALGALSPRGFISGAAEEAAQGDEHAYYIRNALSTALQRLLIRLVRAISDSGESQATWLRKVATSWRSEEIEAVVARLDDSVAQWGSAFGSLPTHETLDSLVHQIERATTKADHPMNFRKASYDYQHRLAAALYHERENRLWQGRVAEVVSRLSLDDYPSYREMALAWIAAAVLCHEDDAKARQALGTVLVGALGVSEPGFGGDTVVAALEGLAQETGRTVKTTGLAAALVHSKGNTQKPTPDPSRVAAGLPPDPWAFELLSRSAVATVLHRQGQQVKAESVLDEAGQLGLDSSYAGYRVLSRLSLACRWLEWGQPDRAAESLTLAREDATHMLDKVLGRGREDLVDALERWLADLQNGAPDAMDADTALRRTGDLTGMMHSLRIQFLAALWSDRLECLKRLAPLALADVTAMDAVLGRLFVDLAATGQPDQTFAHLVQEMDIQYLANQFIVYG